MREPSIRKAGSRDLDAVLAIEAAWPTTSKWTREHFQRELDSRRSYFCVIEERAAVAGYAGLWLLPPEAQVTTVAVRPDMAGRGLGRALLEHLHARALEGGCGTLTLEVGDGNAAALRLYRGLGYKIAGCRKKYYNDGSNALLMTCHPPR